MLLQHCKYVQEKQFYLFNTWASTVGAIAPKSEMTEV